MELFEIDKPNLSRTIEMGEIEAYRIWGVLPTGYLHSWVVSQHIWVPNTIMIAKPTRLTHVCYMNKRKGVIEPIIQIFPDALLGIHAWKTLNRARFYYANVTYTPVIVGKIHMWGDVIEHKFGYRSTHAKIISFNDYKNLVYSEYENIKRVYGV